MQIFVDVCKISHTCYCSEQEIHQQFNTNVYGPLRVMKGVIPHMRSRKSGTIVNISSIAGIDGRPSVSMYAASKFALEGNWGSS